MLFIDSHVAVYISVWQQHDVQELCRVMFDALELTWKNTDQEKLINQLYQGKMKDYVKCLEVCRKLFQSSLEILYETEITPKL